MSYENGERRSSGFALGLTAGVAVMLTASGIAGHLADNRANARVKNIQIENGQLAAQLGRAHEIGGLVLNDGAGTFTLDTKAEDGTAETCTGKYEVQNDIAHAVGTLACTQTVPVAQG